MTAESALSERQAARAEALRIARAVMEQRSIGSSRTPNDYPASELIELAAYVIDGTLPDLIADSS